MALQLSSISSSSLTQRASLSDTSSLQACRTPAPHKPYARSALRVAAAPEGESMSDAYARIREQRKRAKEARERSEKAGPLSGIIGALDFQEDIEEDRSLLAKAKRMKKGEKMSREQYNALSRKVVGTKAGFFGESVDVIGKYTDKGYVSMKQENPLPSILGAVAALGGVGATLLALSSM